MKKLLLFIFALFLWTGAWADKTVWLNPNGLWDQSGAVIEAWVWKTGEEGRWVSPTYKMKVSGTTYYKFVVNDEEDRVNFHRAETVSDAHDWDKGWNAVKPGDNGTFANNTLYTINDWNSYTTSGTFAGDPYSGASKKTVYLWPNTDWRAANANFSVYAYSDENNNCWIPLSPLANSNNGVYTAEVPANCSAMIFVRGSETKAPITTFNNKWNQTGNISLESVANNTIFKIATSGSSDTDATYTTSTNLALLGTASASFAEGGNIGTNANDGDYVTRWGSNGGGDTEWCQIKWATAQTFNTIKLNCEAAMNPGNAPNLAFDIEVSNDGTNWTTKKHVWGKNAGNNEYITVVLNEPATAKFVRFQGVKKGNYGYSFYEFEVYNTDYSSETLNSLTISSFNYVVENNSGVGLSAIGKNASDEEIPSGAIDWNIVSGGTGSFSGDVFTPTSVGTFVINASANSGAITSNSITIFVIDPTAGTELTNDTHKIRIQPRHHTNTFSYELIVTSEENLTNFSGSYWNVNGVSTSLNACNLQVNRDKKSMVITVKSTNAPTMNTPLYINMPGEVNFGTPTYDWIEIASGKTYDVMVDGDKAAVMGTISTSNLSDIRTEIGNASIINVSNAVYDESIDKFTTNNANAIFQYADAATAKAATKTTNSVYSSDPRYYGAPKGLTFVDDPANVPLLPEKAYCDFNDNSVVINRSIAAGKYVTSFMSNIAGDFVASLANGLEAYELTAAQAGQLTFTKVESISKGKGYVIHNTTSGALDMTWRSTGINALLDNYIPNQAEGDVTEVDGVKILGTMHTVETNGSQWILSGGEIKKGNGAMISPYRAYFTGVTPASGKASAVFVDGETTKIGSINANGEINVENGAVYNLAGQRVAHPTKGLYIVNGKKVLIK